MEQTRPFDVDVAEAKFACRAAAVVEMKEVLAASLRSTNHIEGRPIYGTRLA
jgi:hypothetical protein